MRWETRLVSHCEGGDIAVRIDVNGELPSIPVTKGSKDGLQCSRSGYDNGSLGCFPDWQNLRNPSGENVCP